MNKITYLSIILLLALGCNSKKENKNLTALLRQRDAISKSIEKQNTELNTINEEIAKLQNVDNREMVTLQTVSYQPFKHTIEIQSVVSTDQNVMIYPEYAGTIKWHVTEGQKVGAGQVIATISDGGMSSQIQQARIQADLAKTAFEKQQRLWNEKIGSEIQYLQAKTSYEAAQKQIAAMQSQLGRTKVKAPFSGTIDQITMQSGQVVAPGIPIGKIVNLGNLKVLADVSESYISHIRVGTPVEIELIGLDGKMESKISRISSAINPSNRTFQVEIPLSSRGGQVKPNMTAKLAIIDYRNANAIAVPNLAIQSSASGDKYIYAVTDIHGNSGVVEKSALKLGKSNEEYTEVLHGIGIGDKIIKEASKSVVAGSKVKF